MSVLWFEAAVTSASPESDREEVLRAVIQDVLTNNDLKEPREFYGTSGDRRLALVSISDYGVPWPTNFHAALDGYDVVLIQEQERKTDRTEPHLLGIRIEVFDLSKRVDRSKRLASVPVQIAILNAGGQGDRPVTGACSVYYSAMKEGEKWIVRYEGSDDP